MSTQMLIKKCRSCKQQIQNTELFLNHTWYAEMLNVFFCNGFTVNAELEREIKPKIEGVCHLCGAEILSRFALNAVLSGLDETTKTRVNLFHSLITNYALAGQKAKFTFGISESIKGLKLDRNTAYRIIVAAMRLGEKPQHVTEQEKKFMANLKKSGMSNLDLSIIFQRSKETIYRTLKKLEV